MTILAVMAFLLLVSIVMAVVVDLRDRRRGRATRRLSHRHIRSSLRQGRQEMRRARESLAGSNRRR
jgi:hypothetical protein